MADLIASSRDAAVARMGILAARRPMAEKARRCSDVVHGEHAGDAVADLRPDFVERRNDGAGEHLLGECVSHGRRPWVGRASLRSPGGSSAQRS